MNTDSIKAILDAVPKNVTKLVCYGAHCLLMFPCIPLNFISIEFCVNSSHIPDRDVGDKLIQLSRALPRHLVRLDLNSSNLGGINTDKLIQFFQSLPDLNSIRLSYNCFYKQGLKLKSILAALKPKSLREIDLRNNEDDESYQTILSEAVLPPNIESF